MRDLGAGSNPEQRLDVNMTAVLDVEAASSLSLLFRFALGTRTARSDSSIFITADKQDIGIPFATSLARNPCAFIENQVGLLGQLLELDPDMVTSPSGKGLMDAHACCVKDVLKWRPEVASVIKSSFPQLKKDLGSAKGGKEYLSLIEKVVMEE